MPRRTEWLLILLLLLAAASLRIYRLDSVPPGWRDDEAVETTVHAALIRQGHWLLFFPQAEGHEPLYHYLSAAWITVAGQSLFVVRLLSAFLGLLSVAALYRLARHLFGAPVALVAAAALAVSFWGLMYSRFKLRQVGMLAPMLLAFYFFLRLFDRGRGESTHRRDASLAALFLTASLYTYYAARALPVILLVLTTYLFIFQRGTLRGRGRSLALAAGLTLALVAPLAVAIAVTPQSQARLSVVGAPLADLLRGDPRYALRNTAETLGMPAFTGDPEYLYNIPGRPVFEPLGAALFGLGLLLAARRWRQPRYAFLLAWLLGGLAPAFVSTPSASLGHAIAAQPAFFVFPAMAAIEIGSSLRSWARSRLGRLKWRASVAASVAPQLVGAAAAPAIAVVFLIFIAGRDLPDYFARWPALPQVRLLYRADLHEAAAVLRRLPPNSDLALASATLHPADARALALDTPGLDLRARVFTPARVWLFPDQAVPVLLLGSAGPVGFGQQPLAGDFELRTSNLPAQAQPAVAVLADFQNGWQCYGYRLALALAQAKGGATVLLDTYWRVTAGTIPPAPRPVDTLSGDPLPLKFFSHLLNSDGSLLAGDDRLDVDPATLRPGDNFVQGFEIAVPAGATSGVFNVQVGMYDPASGRRVALANGEDGLILQTVKLR